MTSDQRRGAVCISLPWRGIFAAPDGQFRADDRAIAAGMYPKFSGLIVSTTRIQLPVDCVMAGDQDVYRKGRSRGRALKHVFGE